MPNGVRRRMFPFLWQFRQEAKGFNYMKSLSPDDVPHIIDIASALLTTGLYTKLDPDGDPMFVNFDYGEDWKEDGLSGRFSKRCVADAVDLFDDIRRVCTPLPAQYIPSPRPTRQPVDFQKAKSLFAQIKKELE